ncbi:MAG TPA: hypothetical protein VHC00_13820 [Rhizobiaceae bacterium]|nr:hypothetical protein [Rhizobiaceae bacterium]
MPGIENRILRWTAAIIVASALVLQSLTIALAFSDGAGEVRLDQFGNPICNNILNHRDDGTGGSPHRKSPPCCLFGCSMFAPFIAGPSATVAIEGSSTAVRRVLFPALPRIYIRAAAYDPGNPRAPPVI